MVNPAPIFEALAFAAFKHKTQRRKGVDASPYINPPIAVAALLATVGKCDDESLLVGAILHDTVEDTTTSFDELEAAFGREVCALVRELTDDKTLPKQERKRLQIEHASSATPVAKQLKIADKIANLEEPISAPPVDWADQRRREYVDWAERVVAGCRGVNPELEARFDSAVLRARDAV